MAGFAAGAIVGMFSPVLWPSQNNDTKLLQMLYGLSSGVCFTFAALVRQQKEKIYKAISDADEAIIREGLKGDFTVFQAQQLMNAKISLAETVNSRPDQERPRWMQQFGLHSLVNLPAVQEAVIDVTPAPRQLSGIPNPDIAAINEDAVQEIVNPGIMSVLQDVANQYPGYIRLDPEWIDDLCDASALHNMSDRSNHHFMLVGGTQSGKSTLAGVIINKIASQSQGASIVIGSDPKDQVTRWLCKFSRKFDGMKQLGDWIRVATEVISMRKDEIGNNGGSTKNIPELFLVQDEVDTCYGGGKGFPGLVDKETAGNLQALWNYIIKFTAGLKCHGIFMGQSPLSEATGFSRPNLKNICFMALGQMSSYILGKPADFINAKPDIIEVLKQVCEMLDKQGVRYALIVPTRGNPFVALIPQFDIEGMEQKQQPAPQQAPAQQTQQDTSDWLETIKQWHRELGRKPTVEELKDLWLRITGQELKEVGAFYILESLGYKVQDGEL